MTQQEKLLEIATMELGVAENPLGSNNIKYNTAYYGKAVNGNAYPWCMTFVWWCFKEAGLSALFYNGGKTASCTALMKWAKSKGLFVTKDYQLGDVFLFQFDDDDYSEHTGIYTGKKDSRGRYLVIEGNHNERVEQVARTDKELYGAFRAKFDTNVSTSNTAPAPVSVSTVTKTIYLPELKKNDANNCVKAMQILLIGYGYKLPKYGADGDFGAETLTALRSFQRAKGLTADGICGQNTWAKLLGIG